MTLSKNMRWLLNTNNFSLSDREKISNFILDESNRWTQANNVMLFEEQMASYVGCKYAVFVSSGSSANTILAQYKKDTLVDKQKKYVVLPSTTWQTSCAPWIREGFEPLFIDINLADFSIDREQLLLLLNEYANQIAMIFPTSLIGFTPNVSFYQMIHQKYHIDIMMDNCENTLGLFDNKNISSYFTSTTSTYFGHQIQSIEGGFIFTNNPKEYEYFLMLRNHGMTRSLDTYRLSKERFINSEVDPSFDFYCLGNNYRNTDLNAFIGMLDLSRAKTYATKRIELYQLYKQLLNTDKFYLPETRNLCEDVPFCLPIISKSHDDAKKAKTLCINLGIEYRPIISGFLGRQTCYKDFFQKEHNLTRSYINSEFLHTNGFYIGLHPAVTKNQITEVCSMLNSI